MSVNSSIIAHAGQGPANLFLLLRPGYGKAVI